MNCLLLKILGCSLMVLTGTAAGWSCAMRLKRRRDFLRKLRGFLSTLTTALRYQSGDIYRLTAASARQADLPLVPENADKPFMQEWEKLVSRLPRSFSLTEQDIALLLRLGAQLGKTDLEGQLRHLALTATELDALIAESESLLSQRSKLYKTMGFFVGASSAILLM